MDECNTGTNLSLTTTSNVCVLSSSIFCRLGVYIVYMYGCLYLAFSRPWAATTVMKHSIWDAEHASSFILNQNLHLITHYSEEYQHQYATDTVDSSRTAALQVSQHLQYVILAYIYIEHISYAYAWYDSLSYAKLRSTTVHMTQAIAFLSIHCTKISLICKKE